MRHRLRAATVYAAAVLSAAFILGCARQEQPDARIAFTSILPHRDIARRIAGDRFEVDALVGPGQSPHTYSPTPGQMATLSRAAVLFRAGVEFEEGLLPKIKGSMPQLTIVDLRKGIALREIDGHTEQGHGHDAHEVKNDDHDRHHTGKDPHTWLSPVLMKQQAATIADGLTRADPDGAAVYERNLETVRAALDSLNDYLATALAPYRGTELFVFHPAFGYFADEYGLAQKAVEIGGKEPSARALARLIEQAREHKPPVIFVQPQFSQRSAQAVAEQVGCAVVPINPLPSDYFGEMRAMGDTVREGLAER